MAETGGHLKINVPRIEDIVWLNCNQIERYGGYFQEPDNFLNRGSLEWVLEAVQTTVFGYDPYPTIAHKAAIIMWSIIEGHVFRDGNKRTGTLIAYQFARANGFIVKATNDETVEIALKVAIHHSIDFTVDNLIEWFEFHLVPNR